MESYKDIELSHKQIRVLKKIKKKGTISSTPELKDFLSFFLYLNLVKCINEQDIFYMKEDQPRYSLTQTGNMYLQFYKKDIRRAWYPHIISTLALIISILALLKP